MNAGRAKDTTGTTSKAGAVSAAEPVHSPNTASTRGDTLQRRSVLAAVLPHLFTIVLAGSAVLFIAGVARNFSSAQTVQWLMSAGGSLLLQFFAIDPLQLYVTAPLSLWLERRKKSSTILSVVAVTLDPLSRFRKAARTVADVIRAVSDIQTTMLLKAADEAKIQARRRLEHWHKTEEQAALNKDFREKLRRKHVRGKHASLQQLPHSVLVQPNARLYCRLWRDVSYKPGKPSLTRR